MPNKGLKRISASFILSLCILSTGYGLYSYSQNNSILGSNEKDESTAVTSTMHDLKFFEVVEKNNLSVYNFKQNKPVGGLNIHLGNLDTQEVSPLVALNTWCKNTESAQTLAYSGDTAYMGMRTYKYSLENCIVGVIKYNSKVKAYDVPCLDFYIIYSNGTTVEFNNLNMTEYDEATAHALLSEFCTCYALPLDIEELLTLTDLKGNNSLLQDNSLKTLDGTTPEKYFEFDIESGTIIEYRSKDVNAPTDVVIPNTIAGVSVRRIGAKAFYKYFDTNGVTSVTLPDTVTRIDDQAFLANSKLISVSMPSNLKYLGSSAFQGCTALEQIEIKGSVSEISASAFKDCNSLKEVSLPSSLTIISRGAFQNCASLICVTGDLELEVIDSQAFAGTQISNTSIDATNVAIDAFN